MLHIVFVQPVGKLWWYVRRPIITEKVWPVLQLHIIKACSLQSNLKGIWCIFWGHDRAKIPTDNIVGIVIQYRWQVKPTPADYFKIGKVCLSKLVHCRCWVLEFVGRFKNAVYAGFRDIIALCFSKRDGKLSGGHLRFFQSKCDDFIFHRSRYLIPYRLGNRLFVFQAVNAVFKITVIPIAPSGTTYAQLLQCPLQGYRSRQHSWDEQR